MSWFAVDDQLAFHPKIIAAGNAAMGLWVRAGSWSAAHLTDGAIPAAMIGALGGRRRDADKLVDVGLWTQPGGAKSDYVFKDWSMYQFTKSQVEAKRESNRERQRRHRDRTRDDTDIDNAIDKDSAVDQPQSCHTPATGPPFANHSATIDNTVDNVPYGESESENALFRAGDIDVSHGVTPGVIDGVTPSAPSHPIPTHRKDMRIDNDARFEEWWKHYPLKKAKGQAEKAYRQALKHTTHDTLVAATIAYAKTTAGKDREYIAYGSTWLNGKRWLDEDLTPATADSITDWLRDCWENHDTRSVEERSGLTYRQPDPPPDVDIREFNLAARRQWITDHRDQIIARIVAKENPAA